MDMFSADRQSQLPLKCTYSNKKNSWARRRLDINFMDTLLVTTV